MGSSGGLILVVDDDETIREFVDWALSDEGYEVATASDGASALEFATRRSPDLILLDLRMPVMDGRAFARAYRERVPRQAPIVVMTATRDDDSSVADLGATELMAKPFEIDTLLQVVGRHTEPIG